MPWINLWSNEESKLKNVKVRWKYDSPVRKLQGNTVLFGCSQWVQIPTAEKWRLDLCNWMTAEQRAEAAFQMKLLMSIALSSRNQGLQSCSLFKTMRKMSTAEKVECMSIGHKPDIGNSYLLTSFLPGVLYFFFFFPDWEWGSFSMFSLYGSLRGYISISMWEGQNHDRRDIWLMSQMFTLQKKFYSLSSTK